MDWEFAGSLTITGIVVVFSVLILLCIIIKVFGLVLDGIVRRSAGDSGKKKAESEKKSAVGESMKNSVSDGTVAAISAAVAYMMECCGFSEGEYCITDIRPAKRLKRAAQRIRPRSEWSAAGISETMK